MLFVEIYGLLSMRRRTRQTLYELASLQHSNSMSSCLRARERAHHTIYCWVGKRRKRHKIVFRCCAHFSRSFKPHFSTLKTIHSNGYELQVFGFALVSIFVIFNWLCVFFYVDDCHRILCVPRFMNTTIMLRFYVCFFLNINPMI